MANILLSAYACKPGLGSEGGIGWGHVKQAAQFHDVWVITRANNRAAIERELSRTTLPSVHWIYFDLPHWAGWWKRGSRGVRLYYYLWQLGIYFVARKAHRSISFELVHHVTFGMYWMPTFLPLLSIPFVWGPVSGGESVPLSFWWKFRTRGKVYELLRDCARSLGELDPFVRLAARRASVALATSEQTERRLRSLGCRNIAVRSSVGLSSEELRELAAVPPRQRGLFRIVSIGRLLHWKGFELGLRAFADFYSHFPDSEYWVIGDGPERRSLERLAHELGLECAVTFWGALPRDAGLAKLADCDVFLFPSLHDSGGYASVEAMAAGRPVICLDLGGPALQITHDTGVKIPALSPEQAIRDVAIALTYLATDAELRISLGRAARRRVQEHFDWDKRGILLAEAYAQALNKTPRQLNEQPIRNTL